MGGEPSGWDRVLEDFREALATGREPEEVQADRHARERAAGRQEPVAAPEHCLHWQEGDGPCCRCKEPNWCPDEGETPEALARYEQRRRCPVITA